MLIKEELIELFWDDVAKSPHFLGVAVNNEQEKELKEFLDDASKIFSLQWNKYSKDKSVNLPTFICYLLSLGISLGLRLNVEAEEVKKG